MSHRIAVLGAGSWGIAVARLLFDNGNAVRLWEFDPEDCRRLESLREHPSKLPGIRIPSEIRISSNLQSTLHASEYICLAVPSHTVRSVCELIRQVGLTEAPTLVNLAKGIEIDSGMRMSQVILSTLSEVPAAYVVTLSGPSHAEEVSRGMPTSVVAAGVDITTAARVRDVFSNRAFRVYSSPDITGVELGGSLKNIIAIAAGILDGLGGGDNARGALFTRGLAEISRLGVALGAVPLTFAGLSGLGDLVTTCISRHSRNRAFGEKIGQGKSFEAALSEMTMVVEGVKTTAAAMALATRCRVEMPITGQVHRVLFEQHDPREALVELMTRDLKSEI